MFPAFTDTLGVCEFAGSTPVIVALVIVMLVCPLLLAIVVRGGIDIFAFAEQEAASTGQNEYDDDDDLPSSIASFMVRIDTAVTGVFSTWANYVQSGPIGLLLALHPSVKIVYTCYPGNENGVMNM